LISSLLSKFGSVRTPDPTLTIKYHFLLSINFPQELFEPDALEVYPPQIFHGMRRRRGQAYLARKKAANSLRWEFSPPPSIQLVLGRLCPSVSRVAVRRGGFTNDDFIFWILRELVYLQIRLKGGRLRSLGEGVYFDGRIGWGAVEAELGVTGGSGRTQKGPRTENGTKGRDEIGTAWIGCVSEEDAERCGGAKRCHGHDG